MVPGNVGASADVPTASGAVDGFAEGAAHVAHPIIVEAPQALYAPGRGDGLDGIESCCAFAWNGVMGGVEPNLAGQAPYAGRARSHQDQASRDDCGVAAHDDNRASSDV